MISRLYSRRLLVVTISLLICSVVLNVMLARETRKLRARVLTFRTEVLAIKAEQSLAAGTVLPPIEAKDLDGHPKTVEYNSSDLPTVLYVFTPPCGWCAKNISNVKTLAEETRGRYRTIGLSLSSTGLREYVNKNGLEFPIFTDLPPQVVLSYRLGGTPETLLVSNAGKLIREWKGAYTGSTKKEIEEYFKLELPGLNEQQPK
jgi:peroxiredoxin